jgi:serine/threonine protein kinase
MHPSSEAALMSGESSLESGYYVTAEEATKAWNRRFRTHRVKVARRDPELFQVGKRLGSGGVGEVWETKIGSIPVALKRIYAAHITEAILAEVNIMQQMARKRHHHIVQLIGSYEKRHTNISELGLLIWPVATCDLAALLHDFNIAYGWWVHGEALGEETDYDEEDVIYAIESLARLESTMSSPDIIKKTDPEFLELYNKTRSRLQSSIGCIANAVEWLHECHIRHKDLKPSQVLISASGLWLSDFGWSKDVSEMTCSTTVGGKTTTPKYLAPERALKQPCGRSEDIFSLGCIFLEIGHQVFRLEKTNVPWFQPGWLYSENVEQVRELASTLVTLSPDLPLSHEILMALVVRMLNNNPALRPSITKVVDTLSAISEFSGHCCSPTPSQSVDHQTVPVTLNGHYLSYQDSNSMFARGHKRFLVEAPSGHQLNGALTKRIRPDYFIDDPRRHSTSATTNGISKRRQLSMIDHRPQQSTAPPTANATGLSSVRPKSAFNAARELTTILPGIADAKQSQPSRKPTGQFTTYPFHLPLLTGQETTHYPFSGPNGIPIPSPGSQLEPWQHFGPEYFETSYFEPRSHSGWGEATRPLKLWRFNSSIPPRFSQ